MGRLRTFKKAAERTHIVTSSRPGTFKRPGAGVAIRAPATQTLPPVAGEGKLPTANPIFQPWSRCHRERESGSDDTSTQFSSAHRPHMQMWEKFVEVPRQIELVGV